MERSEWSEWNQNEFEKVVRQLSRTDPDTEVTDIDAEGLRALPEELWRFERLRELSIHSEYLDGIPAGIGRLTRLESL
ncbi:hypothetical protein [Streptomyces sp. NPDC101150]|uniref:hypothetical protein n=1 Tax=Streptomyces sp. NPDC101150 TaxID=3366114 RepID=UPI0037F68C96